MDPDRIAEIEAATKAKVAAKKSNGGLMGTIKALGAGALEGATLGAAGPIMDRTPKSLMVDMATYGPMGSVLSPVIRSMTQTTENGPAETALDEAQKDHPWASLLGNIVGGTAFGGLTSSVGRKLAKEAGEAAIPYITKSVQNLVGTGAGRVVSSTAVGGAEGAGYAANKDKDLLPSTLGGAIGGGAGQTILGETVPAIVNAIGKSGLPKKAADYVQGQANTAMGVGGASGRQFPYEDVAKRRQELGENATLMDASPAYRQVGATIANVEPKHALDILYRYGEGSPRAAQIAPEFEAEVGDAMMLAFKDAGGTGEAPRSLSAIKQNAIKQRELLQPEFKAALESSPHSYTVNEIKNLIDQEVDFRLTSTATNKVEKRIDRLLERLSTESVALMREAGDEHPPAGGLKPEALLAVRRDLDMIANKAYKAGDRELMSRALKARKAVSDHMVDTIPGFGSINARYSNEFSYERAVKTAYDAFKSNNIDSDALKIAMDAASPADLPGFMEGAASAIVDKFGTNTSTLTTAKDFLTNTRTQEKLVQMFGAPAAQVLTSAADRATTFAATTKQVSGHAVTRPEMATFLETAVRGGIIALGMSRMFGKLPISTSTAATAGAMGRQAKVSERASQSTMYPLADQWLSEAGPQADANMGTIKRLSENWYPSTSLAGLGFMEPAKGPVDMLMKLNFGNAPAQGAAIGGAAGAQQK
jgi:hypothetical protein